MLYHILVVAAQLFVLLFTAAGWGFWIFRLTCKAAHQHQRFIYLLCGLAGLCAGWLLLQDLVYLNVRLLWSSWLALGIALMGVAGILREMIGAGKRATRQHSVKILAVWLGIGLPIFGFQARGLIYRGANNYYGYAHQDQVNYVQLAQFLIEKPYSTGLKDIGLHPWLVKCIDVKAMRIGQSVANGYLAVVTRTDAKMAYGTISIFFVALLGLVMMELLRRLGANRWLAWLGALWTGILPAITATHLNGFFSQTAILFIFPAVFLAYLATARNFRLSCVSAALLFAFLLSAYTEIYVLEVGLVGAIIISLPQLSWKRRLVLFSFPTTGSVLILAPYTHHDAWAFLANQYRVASNPLALADLMPNAGTWRGWSENFLSTPAEASFFARVSILLGLFLVILFVVGFFSRSLSRALTLAATAAIPIAVLSWLLSESVLPKYAFGKLVVTFLPLAVVFISLGVARLPLLVSCAVRGWSKSHFSLYVLPKPLPLTVAGAGLLFIVLIAAAAQASWAMQERVVTDSEILAAVDSPEARKTYREIEKHPERIYVIKEEHTIINAWLAYHARHADVYADVDTIGDRSTPLDQFKFRKLPHNLAAVWYLTRNGAKSQAYPQGSPEVIVRNPQGIDQDGAFTWYWVGDSMEFELGLFDKTPAAYNLRLHAMYGPANPSPRRIVTLKDERTGQKQTRDFTRDAYLAFSVWLQPGYNYFEFHVDKPTEWLVRFPTDPRKHMVRVQELSLTSATLSPPSPRLKVSSGTN